ncbi:MAG: DUF3018 family protein [Betaproteobacteria bacterium]|nr:DUF3018 family protein [Betaproteobacteria bacterium]
MRRYRERKRKSGMRLVSVWVPDDAAASRLLPEQVPTSRTGAALGASRGTRKRLPALPPATSRMGAIFNARAVQRRRRALALSTAALKRLETLGVKARIVGSLAEGRFRHNSDVDYLIVDRAGISEQGIIKEIERCMRGFRFDVIFFEYLPDTIAPIFASAIRHDAPVIREA